MPSPLPAPSPASESRDIRRRRLFGVKVALSALLFVGTMSLWARTRFFRTDVIAATCGDRLIRVHIKENGFVIASIAPWPQHEPLSWGE